MISTLFTIHGHNESRVAQVMKEMRTLGAPSIRVVDCGDHYMSLEGVHRLEAAARLEIAPALIVLSQEDMVEASSLDWDWMLAGESYTAGELAGEAYSQGAGCYRIESDGTISLRFNGQYIPGDVG